MNWLNVKQVNMQDFIRLILYSSLKDYELLLNIYKYVWFSIKPSKLEGKTTY